MEIKSFNITLFLILGISFTGYSQFDNGKKFVAIPPTKQEPKVKAPITPTPKKLFDSNIDFNTLPSNPKPIELPSKLSFLPKEEFANPGDKIVEKLNQKAAQESMEIPMQNQYLGDYRSNTKSVRILCRDFGEVDGDLIKVMLNGVQQGESFYLGGYFKEIVLPIKEGFNKIDFEALTQGTSGPNTAEFQIYDDKGQLISANQWNLATGFKATTVIIKETKNQ